MFDVAIIGLGCAGYTAAVYTARYKLSTLVTGEKEGGMGMSAAEVGNWPGEQEIAGPDLMEKFRSHAVSYDEVTHKIGRIESIEKTDAGFGLTYTNGDTVEAKTIIFATGSNKRHLGAPGEEELAGKGVTYCATCDAFFFRNKKVAVIGGGDSAVEGAAITAQVAETVYLIHRRNEFRAEPYWVDKVREKDNVVFVLERNVKQILGEERVTGVQLDQPFEGSDTIELDGVFIEVGSIPAVSLAESLGCELDEKNHLAVDAGMRTTVEGVFGAGDVTNASNHFAQFATAAGEGAVAANSVFTYLEEH